MRSSRYVVVLVATLLTSNVGPAQSAPAQSHQLEGFWLGTLGPPGAASLRIQITVKADASGKLQCTVDSLDQNRVGLQCADVTFSAPDFSFDVPAVKAHWSGKLSEDRHWLIGGWSQGVPLPLAFERRNAAEKPTTPQFSPAMAPVSAEEMQTVLTRDLSQALKDGALAPTTSAGVTIGVVRNGVRRVFAYGTAKPDSLFEIGSVTKTFTGLMLAQLIEQQKVKPETPVRELLPAETVSKPGSGREITVLDLVTQHSGLPGLPDNFKPVDARNPYADYDAARLYEYLRRHGVERHADAAFGYSNLGVGLLGHALSLRARGSYAQVLEDEVTGPLGLKDTVVTLTPDQERRLIEGHGPDNRPARKWEMNVLAGAGAIRSTAGDLLTYLEAQLHPDKIASALKETENGRTLPAAIALSQELRAAASPQLQIGFAWVYSDKSATYWHNGATGGYSSFVFFNPKGDYAAVVLMNRTIGLRGSFADLLGTYLRQRFAGEPAVSLASR